MQNQLAVQLYSLRESLQTDFDGVIRRLAEIGYPAVEPYGGLDAQAVVEACRRYSLKITSAHLAMPLGDAQAQVFRSAETLGINRIIVPWLPAERFTTRESVQQVADELNAAAEACAREGYTLGYHNHDFEFTRIEGRTAYDLLLEMISPDVLLEVDTYWVQTGGENVAALIQRLGQRVPLLHIKDGPTVRGEPMTAVGEGKMNFAPIIAAAQADWYIVELDQCATDMMQAIEKSYHYLTSGAV